METTEEWPATRECSLPTSFQHIYTNDQLVHDGTRSFIYADDLCITAQFPTFSTHNLNEEPAKGYESPWLTWRCLNRLRTGYTGSKEQRKKWEYFNGDICACGLDEENTAHMLRCSLLTHPCTLDDLLKFNDII